ncbi:flagellar hook-associated protein FlgK [Thalassotalea atypica]|uniref:flagellar hook-associated protein FlgK n=1 Tax=Thalassotalea atypica TaxID=2054316 RepID=UPI0025733A56|nr:flagellar hook-associated protein FlgK [Thalassotalea atypica]
MSINLYQTGVSGLLAAQQQLATTGHNIANVNTEGYNRQRAEQQAAVGDPFGNNFLGSGTYIQDVTRIYNQFSYKEQLLATSTLGGAESSHESLNQLNEIMSFSGNAVMNSIDRFYQAVNGIADNPSDLGLRSIALTQAEILASDFNSLNENFDQLEKSNNGEIDQIAKQISEISVELAKINEAILQNDSFSTSGQPNDLLDKRDILVTELGQYAKVNTVTDQNGVMTVMIGGGNTLVAGITALTVEVNAGDPDPNQTTLSLVGPNSKVAIDERSIGGSLGAKISFRDNDLMQIRSEINRIAMGISETLNAAQADGLDLNQQQGKNIFTDINAPVLASSRVLELSGNSAGVSAIVNITDITLVPTDEFEIQYDGANYQMTNKRDGTVTNLGAAGSGTYATAFGFEFVETGAAPVAGDAFVIRPTENSASLIAVTLNDGSGIAASAAIEIQPSDNNVSAGKVEITNMSDPVAARAMMPMRVDVLENPPGSGTYTYQLYDNAGVATGPLTSYTPPVPPTAVFDVPALPALPPAAAGTGLFTIEISGTPSGSFPSSPEQFVIADAFGVGNGNNAVTMALTQEAGVLNSGNETFTQSLGISTADVGSKAKSAELVSETAESLHTQAFNRNQATSGVNLDEEAANLMRFQQAYQAASQIISTANTIFDTLLSVAR